MFNIANINPGMPLNRVHAEYAALTDVQKRDKSLTQMQRYIDTGAARARQVVSAIMDEQPRDRFIAAPALRFRGEDALQVAIPTGEVLDLNDHALDQVASRAGMPIRFLHDLQGSDWGRKLAATNMNELLGHQEGTRYLVRQVGTKVRGVLSDAYKRIDSRPTVDALIGAAQAEGAVIVDGTYSETRVALKVVIAKPIEVFPGEFMVFGLDYSNSDYGDGAMEFSAFLLRLLCLNGATTVKELRKVHIGRRFNGDDAASERTLRLDAAAQASMARDQVKALLSPAATDNLVKQIQEANARPADPKRIEGFLKTRANKSEAEAITEKFASADVVDLPPGQTAWRLSNAISWLARETDDGRRKLELERVAGEAMKGV